MLFSPPPPVLLVISPYVCHQGLSGLLNRIRLAFCSCAHTKHRGLAIGCLYIPTPPASDLVWCLVLGSGRFLESGIGLASCFWAHAKHGLSELHEGKSGWKWCSLWGKKLSSHRKPEAPPPRHETEPSTSRASPGITVFPCSVLGTFPREKRGASNAA